MTRPKSLHSAPANYPPRPANQSQYREVYVSCIESADDEFPSKPNPQQLFLAHERLQNAATAFRETARRCGHAVEPGDNSIFSDLQVIINQLATGAEKANASGAVRPAIEGSSLNCVDRNDTF